MERDRLTTQQDRVYKEMTNSHGVAILRRESGTNHYEMVFIETPKQHIAFNPNKVALLKKAEIKDEEVILDTKVHKLIKRIRQNELATV